jgi:hypothetical protein
MFLMRRNENEYFRFITIKSTTFAKANANSASFAIFSAQARRKEKTAAELTL